MGHRTVKRVPLDFDAPLNERLGGLSLPVMAAVPERRLRQRVHARGGVAWPNFAQLILLMAEAPERGLASVAAKRFRCVPTKPPRENVAELTGGLAGRPPRLPFGHDAMRPVVGHEMPSSRRPGCPMIGGHVPSAMVTRSIPTTSRRPRHGSRPSLPTGDGWQLWETTSEGSPVSPVFETAEALAGWCEEGATPFGSMRWSASQWLASFRTETTDVDTLLVFRDGEQVAP
jgi:hypothetical protein